MSCFDDAPEFIAEDNRRFRPNSPVTRDMMEAKHEALFPPSVVKDKTIIDFGSCTRSSVPWVLSHGAKHYTGSETHEAYASLSHRLLAGRHGADKFAIHQQPIEQYLAAHAGKQQYDIVSLLGVLYVFTDYYSVLQQA